MTDRSRAGHAEIELKLRLRPADMRRLEDRLARIALRAAPGRRVRTTYYDTPDLRLHAAGLALRTRADGKARLISVKADRLQQGGLQTATEFEAPLGGRQPTPHAIADPGLRARVAAALAGARPAALFHTDVERRSFLVAGQHGVVDVALDRGRIRSGARSEPVCEAEFELVAGAPDAVFDVAAGLLRAMPAEPCQPSKADRGLALWREGRGLARPAGPGAVSFETAPAAAAHWLSACVHAVGVHLFQTLTDASPEGPHQLRVWLRRLRAAIWLFRPLIDRKVARDLAACARDMGRIVGPLRDADVLVGGLLVPAARAADPELAGALEAVHRRTRSRIRRELRAMGATATLLRMHRLAALGGWQRGGRRARDAAAGSSEALTAPRLARLWRSVRTMGDRLAGLSPEARHELRKAIKKLRYAIEMTNPSDTQKRFVSALRKLQDALGALNDQAVLRSYAPDLGDPALTLRLERLVADLPGESRNRGDLAMGRACRHWQALVSLPLPWEAASPAPPPRLAAPNR